MKRAKVIFSNIKHTLELKGNFKNFTFRRLKYMSLKISITIKQKINK